MNSGVSNNVNKQWESAPYIGIEVAEELKRLLLREEKRDVTHKRAVELYAKTKEITK